MPKKIRNKFLRERNKVIPVNKDQTTIKPPAYPPPPLNNSQKVNVPAHAPPSFMSTLLNGMSFGAGSEIGHKVMGGLFTNDKSSNIIPEPDCNTAKVSLENCLTNESGFNCEEKQQAYNKCVDIMKKYSEIPKN